MGAERVELITRVERPDPGGVPPPLTMVRVLQEHGVEAIVHTAAMSHPTLSLDFPLATFAAKVDGTLGVLEAARLAGVRRIVNFSSEGGGRTRRRVCDGRDSYASLNFLRGSEGRD